MNDFSRTARARWNLDLAERIAFLDWLRILACFSVVFGHRFEYLFADFSRFPQPTIQTVANGLGGFCWCGISGIVLFFLISGYVVTHILERQNAGEFLVRRIFRIYPLYATAVLTQTAVEGWPGWAVMGPRLLLAGDLLETPYALAGVEWTLRIEVAFYAFMAGIRATKLFERGQLLAFCYLAICVVLWRTNPIPAHAGFGHGYWNLYAPFLLAGSVIYLFERRRIGGFAAWGLCLAILAMHHALLPAISTHLMQSNSAAIAAVLFVFAWATRLQISTPAWARRLAGAAYPIYLFHQWSWPHLTAMATRLGGGEKLTPWFVLALVVALSFVLELCIERPCIRFGKRLSQRLFTLPHESLIHPIRLPWRGTATATKAKSKVRRVRRR